MAQPTSQSSMDLEASRNYCRRVAREQARNFYHGMKLVPEPKKSAMYALYAWMRQADDLADEPGELTAKQRALEEFRRETHLAIAPTSQERPQLPAGIIWPAFRQMAMTHAVPAAYFDAMIDGQLLDQSKTRYRTFEELYDYCYNVASVVGLSCVQIWGSDGDAQTRKLAEWRGIAFQLTNILRDVLEDAQRGRVYLPAEDFDLFELNPSMFTLGKPEQIAPGLEKVAQRAHEYYEKSAALDARVHRDGRPCLWAMTQIYRGLLDKIRRDPPIVLRQRVRLSPLRKAWIALGATLRGGAR
jgi:15-cis-phytoene synthase